MAKNLEISFLLDFYGDVLTEKQRDVMEQYYNDDLSLAEIADNFGITRQGVRDSIKRGEGILLELEQKVGFAQRYRAVQQGVAQLESLAREDGTIVYHLSVAEDDMGRVIGKQGRIAKAIRVVMRAAAVRQGEKVMVEID